MPGASQRRILDRVPRPRDLPMDARKAMQVFHVLATQHLQQCLGGHHAHRPAADIHHGKCVHAVMQRQRSGGLLFIFRPDAWKGVIRERTDD